MLEHKTAWKVEKVFAEENSNDDLWLILTYFMARSNLLSGLLYEKG